MEKLIQCSILLCAEGVFVLAQVRELALHPVKVACVRTLLGPSFRAEI